MLAEAVVGVAAVMLVELEEDTELLAELKEEELVGVVVDESAALEDWKVVVGIEVPVDASDITTRLPGMAYLPPTLTA